MTKFTFFQRIQVKDILYKSSNKNQIFLSSFDREYVKNYDKYINNNTDLQIIEL